MQNQFSRTERILGAQAMQKLRSSRVAIFGIGGVGGYVVEGLARSGIGSLDLIDHDTVDVTNLNRQIIATWDTIGQNKVDVAAKRVTLMNPDCVVTTYKTFFLPETQDQFDFQQYDYVVDAIDTVAGKIGLILAAQKVGVPVISAMGAGNKIEASDFEVSDIYATSVCPLAHVMRRELRKRGVSHLKVVYSKEKPRQPIENLAESVAKNESHQKQIPGSVVFAPAVAGMIIAGEVVKDLISENK